MIQIMPEEFPTLLHEKHLFNFALQQISLFIAEKAV